MHLSEEQIAAVRAAAKEKGVDADKAVEAAERIVSKSEPTSEAADDE